MKYYSPEEIAEQFNLKPGTVRKWIREGKLKAVKLGHLWRIREDDLNNFVNQDKKESAARMFNQWVEDGKKE
jgi:excisionase family DNA binding protein